MTKGKDSDRIIRSTVDKAHADEFFRQCWTGNRSMKHQLIELIELGYRARTGKEWDKTIDKEPDDAE